MKKQLLKPATQSDIKRLELKMNKLATKEEIAKLATKEELANLRSDMAVEFIKVRSEMATREELEKNTQTLNKIYQMLDDETRFTKIIEVEHPQIVRRLERVEDKLGLPHTLLGFKSK